MRNFAPVNYAFFIFYTTLQWHKNQAYQRAHVAFAVLLGNIILINSHLQNIYFLRVSGRTTKISKNTVFLWCIWVYYGT